MQPIFWLREWTNNQFVAVSIKIAKIFREKDLMRYRYTQLPNQCLDVFIVYIRFGRPINLLCMQLILDMEERVDIDDSI